MGYGEKKNTPNAIPCTPYPAKKVAKDLELT
jgi:hypothetical protein